MYALPTLLLAAWCGATLAEPVPGKSFEFKNPDQLRQFFKANHYDLETWSSGDRTVPRFYLHHIPERWRQKVVDKLTVQQKVRSFLFIYAPIVLKANEEVLQDRVRMHALLRGHAADRAAGSEGEAWLEALARRYGLKLDLSEPAMLRELDARVDAIPISLALAQAAMESGWGTSQFADMGNALFGQWTWGDDGITPTNQRTGERGNYKVKAFARPDQSVAAYLHNLNTHPSYAELRRLRAWYRAQERQASGHVLAAGLVGYSERGKAYVDELRALMAKAHLAAVEDATLRDGEPIWLVPVGEGSR
jgi:uncharacterized FlgJ-related protein